MKGATPKAARGTDAPPSFLGRLRQRLNRGDSWLTAGLGDLFRGREIDAAVLDELDTRLITADVGVAASERMHADLKAAVARRVGADVAAPGAVVFDALQAARARGIEVMLADTAGRLHSQSHLMEELKKVRRVIQRVDPSAPHEVLLVLDANQGQNALAQAQQFSEAVGVTGLVLTKLDGTARGGIVIAIAQQLRIPIRFIGVGESPEDFGEFDPAAFAAVLLEGLQAGCAAAGQTGAA